MFSNGDLLLTGTGSTATCGTGGTTSSVGGLSVQPTWQLARICSSVPTDLHWVAQSSLCNLKSQPSQYHTKVTFAFRNHHRITLSASIQMKAASCVVRVTSCVTEVFSAKQRFEKTGGWRWCQQNGKNQKFHHCLECLCNKRSTIFYK